MEGGRKNEGGMREGETAKEDNMEGLQVEKREGKRRTE
jgi:hypothetical protein